MEHLIIAFDDHYITKEMLEQLNTKYKLYLKEINRYVKYLQSAKAKPIINNEEFNK